MSEKKMIEKKVFDAKGNKLEKRASDWSFISSDFTDFQPSDTIEGLEIQQTFTFKESEISDRLISWKLVMDITWKELINFAQHAAKTLWIQRELKADVKEALKLDGQTVRLSSFRPKNERKAKDPVAEFEQAAKKLGIPQDQIDRLLNRS